MKRPRRIQNKFSSTLTPLAVVCVFLVPRCAMAHESGDTAGGFISGLTHPLFGLDHVVAMIAVGLWGGQLKQPAIWILPITFSSVMAIGGMLGVHGVPLPPLVSDCLDWHSGQRSLCNMQVVDNANAGDDTAIVIALRAKIDL